MLYVQIFEISTFFSFFAIFFSIVDFSTHFRNQFFVFFFDFNFSIIIKFHANFNWYTILLHYCEFDNILKYIIIFDEYVFWSNNVFKIRFDVHFMKRFVCTNENDFFVYFFHISMLKIVSEMSRDNFNKINVVAKRTCKYFFAHIQIINQTIFIYYKQFNYRYNNW